MAKPTKFQIEVKEYGIEYKEYDLPVFIMLIHSPNDDDGVFDLILASAPNEEVALAGIAKAFPNATGHACLRLGGMLANLLDVSTNSGSVDRPTPVL